MCHKRFRPQQGLSIMNDYMRDYRDAFRSFRTQQGLSIMNVRFTRVNDIRIDGFRPQQGLSIMNTNGYGIPVRAHVIVSVPNRG